ncbi:hypothetical protein ASD64_09035 [Mesorhizobium sp. Root157]|uniref:hypothetical protein n=1 Tax=Mesorhizobium sp. Root157 TaxID=1736477 RepID=UPI0006F483E1|nr:hypothetical protein [Mesorhizobium sp. Root157]KQZ81889.1 hypothetical protein ASD64_09035 [Mesorhizobium sp. Root157]
MTDSMIPIIRQLHDADGDQARARVLLAMPDAILFKYAGTLGDACQRAQFAAGAEFVHRRIVIMKAVRGPDGLLPEPIRDDFEEYRAALASFAQGGSHG